MGFLQRVQKSFHYKTLLKAVMRHSVAGLNASDAKEVSSSMTVIANEKLKAEKEATAGKKKTGIYLNACFSVNLKLTTVPKIRCINLVFYFLVLTVTVVTCY